ncbi:MAG: helix-turn-helix domain-containing protein [Candidatus Nanopelagicales bacterium]|nr:helix-turn-helix domain-containing protein [Candidatus Nanopelagicales bacterium]
MTAHLLTIPETQDALGGLGRTKVYELMDAGAVDAVKIGRRRFVVATSVAAFVDKLQASPDGAA